MRQPPRTPPIGVRRLRLGGLLLGVGALAALAAGCAKPSAQRLNQDGNGAYARGDYPQALDNYRKAQLDRPDLPALNYNAGNALNQQGEYPRAIAEALRATRAGDGDVQARAFYSIGASYYREGKLREALDAFKGALRIDPNDRDAKYNVEVIQRRLDKEAADLAALRNQATPTPSPTPAPQAGAPTPDAGQQPGTPTPPGRPGRNGQQAGQPSPQPGQPQGQPQPDPNGQPNANGQPGQPGQSGQPPPGQAGQPQPGQPNQPGNSSSSASGGSPGATGTPGPSIAAQQRQLNQDLQKALAAYAQSHSIEEALRILDILAEQERIAQAEQSGRSDPRTLDK